METQILLKTSVSTGKLVQYRSPALTKLGYRVCFVFTFYYLLYENSVFVYNVYWSYPHSTVFQLLKNFPYRNTLLISWFSYFNPLSTFNAALTSMEVGHLLESIRVRVTEEIMLSFPQKPENDNSFSNRDGLVLNFDLFFSAQGKSYKRDKRYIWEQGAG